MTAVAQHDTGSAVAGTPLEPGSAYISSGTWSLVGVELQRPLVTPNVARENVTNEGGAYGTTRFLKNVMGLWILESCREEWERGGLDVRYDHLLDEVALLEETPAVIYPDDPHLLHPQSMLSALADQAARDRPARSRHAECARTKRARLARLRYASVLATSRASRTAPSGASGSSVAAAGTDSESGDGDDDRCARGGRAG